MMSSTIYKVMIIAAVILLPMAIQGADASDEDPDGCCIPTNRIAVLETDYGTIRFVLYENLTPITTENFIGLAERGHYDGVVFHRIVKDFVIQTGDGGGGSTIPLEIHPNATHVDGAVGMARSSDPDSASDQFYICDGPQHGLDGDYAVFGVVIEGMDVVRRIADVPVYGENNPRPGAIIPPLWYNLGMPKEDVYIQKAHIEYQTNDTAQQETATPTTPPRSTTALSLLLLTPAILAIIYVKQRKKHDM